MTENGYVGPRSVSGHVGRIPNFAKTQVNNMGNVEPPACIQNAMMTKDKKPFTYTPGGLDFSQIRTPSMAKRIARQRSLEEHEAAYAAQQASANGGNYQNHPGGLIPPPPPPPQAPAPPPPPPLLIEAPNSKSPKPIMLGERPEIVIPENPIGMLRKTNSPYHWEAEQSEMQKMGSVPKFMEKVPSPLTVKMPPATFSQQPPQSYQQSPQSYQQLPQSYQQPKENNMMRSNYPQGSSFHNTPDSPVHKPEAQYAHQKNTPTPTVNTRDMLQRQDSLFNKSPLPYATQSISPNTSNGSPFSPSPNSPWRQPERRDSPVKSPNSPQCNRGPFSPTIANQSPVNTQGQMQNINTTPTYHTLPRSGQKIQDNYVNNLSQVQKENNYSNANNNYSNNTNARLEENNPHPWRANTLNRNIDSNNNNQQYVQSREQPSFNNKFDSNQINKNQNYSQPWKSNEDNIQNRIQNTNDGQQNYNPLWVQNTFGKRTQDSKSPPSRLDNNRTSQNSINANQPQPEQRYQSHMSIPVTPREPKPKLEFNNTPQQKEVVYVMEEPVYYCPESPKSLPPWVQTQKEKTKTPPPEWCTKHAEGLKQSRELLTPPRDKPVEPEWIQKSNEMQRNARDVVSPPKNQQSFQPVWSTKPSDNRKSIPRDNPNVNNSRVIPIQMEVSSAGVRNNQTDGGNQQPQLRIVIDMKQNPDGQNQQPQAPYSQPTQRIMRVLSPQLVRLDDDPNQREIPSLNRNVTRNEVNQPNQGNQPRTRIIPIQIEGGGSDEPNRSFGGRY